MPEDANNKSVEGDITKITNGEPSQKGKVEIDDAQYDQLLDSISALEEENAQLRAVKQKEDIDLDSLLKEGKQEVKADDVQQPNIDEMSNTELANFIFKNVDQIGKQIFNKLAVMEVKSEIKDAMSKHEDFMDYQEATQAIAMKNPQLSIEQAYKLAKAENPKVEKKGEDGKVDRTLTERRLNLPARPVFGEKPTASIKGTQSNTILTSKQAATAAWDEVMAKQA